MHVLQSSQTVHVQEPDEHGHIDITWELAANISSCDVVAEYNSFMQDSFMAAPPTGGEGGSMVPTEWVQILQKWCNDHNSSFPKGLATRLNVVGAVPLWWIIGLELMPQALLIPPSANLGKRPREQVVPYVDTAFADGQLHAKPKPKPAAAAKSQPKSYGKHVLGKSRDNQAKAGDETAEMIAKVEKLRADPKYRNAGLTFAQAKTLVGNRDDADAAGQQRIESLLSKEEIDTSKLVGEFDFAVLDIF